MQKKLEKLVIIPVRSGSKGIPGKNIKIIAGKPLLAWSVEQVKKSPSVDRVIVATDSNEIAEIANLYGAETPFLRPAEISNDEATTEEVLLYTLKWLKINEGYQPDIIILIQATSPVRFKGVIENSIQYFIDQNADSLLSVCEFKHFLWKNKYHPEALYNHKQRPRRQDINSDDYLFKENGSIYITKVKSLLESKNRLSGKIAMYPMTEEESMEIDNNLDWMLVEKILEKTKCEA